MIKQKFKFGFDGQVFELTAKRDGVTNRAQRYEMQQKHISCLPTLSVKYPWFVAQNLEADEDDQIFYTMHDSPSHYRCRIPELVGRCIRGCVHGWVILSDHPRNIMWSLWNPVTSKTISLPPLTLKDDGEDFESDLQCCLSSPPNNPTSVFMLTTSKAPTIVFCHLNHCKRKRLRWKEMTYAKQLNTICGGDGGILYSLTCCNGRVYALHIGDKYDHYVVQVDIVVKDNEVVLSLSALGEVPYTFCNGCQLRAKYLKGHGADLFYIKVGFDTVPKETVGAVHLFKWDWNTMIWEKMEDLKDAILFLDLYRDESLFYRDAVSSALGGYLHILGKNGKVIYSYDVKEQTISVSSMSCLEQSTRVSLWECRLHADHGESEPENEIMVRPVRDDEAMVRPVRDDEVDTNNTTSEDPILLNIPLDVQAMIIELCVGVEYLNMRATCKHFQVEAPMIRWSNETCLKRLQTYSLISPWLTVLDTNRGIVTFIDPMFGNKYFRKIPQKLIGNLKLYCSRYGWLLFYIQRGRGELFFYNPFKNDIRELPNTPCLDSMCFSAPPTSPNCMVFGLSASWRLNVFKYTLSSKSSSWNMFRLDFGGTTPDSFLFSTMYDKCLFALNQGALEVFLESEEGDSFRNNIVAEAPRGRGCSSSQYFLVSCDQHLLLVVMDELDEFVKVWKRNDSTEEWEKIDGLGRHMIFICGTTCLCMEAKTPEMENKIYFPRLHSKSEKIVFYSLETRRYHTFNGRYMEHCLGDLFGTKYHVCPSAWIEPSWS